MGNRHIHGLSCNTVIFIRDGYILCFRQASRCVEQNWRGGYFSPHISASRANPIVYEIKEMKAVNYFHIAWGFAALILGMAGVVLPLIPTTPLLMAACFGFAKGSPRLHNYLTGTKIYKKYLCKFAEKREMNIKTKLTICGAATFFVSIPFVLTPFWWMRIIIFCVLAFKWYYFFWQIKTADSTQDRFFNKS